MYVRRKVHGNAGAGTADLAPLANNNNMNNNNSVHAHLYMCIGPFSMAFNVK